MIPRTLLTLSAILIFSGCCETKYIDVPVEIKVPVKCIVPHPKKESCPTPELNDAEFVVKLAECVLAWEDAAKVCQ